MISSLPLWAWPEADRDAWLDASKVGNKLRRGGRASHMKQVTRNDLQARYGAYLEFLRGTGALHLRAGAGTQVTRGHVRRYIEGVQPGWSSVTLAQSIY